MRETIQSAFVALVLNILFNFSEMVFMHLKENIYLKGDNAYLMYPRFLQMIIDDQLPLLPRSDVDIIKLEHMTDVTLNRVQTYRGRPTKPPHRRLIGHLANLDYVAPANRKWRHDNSDSNREDIVVPPADDQDDDDQDGQGDGGNAPNVPSTAATTPTVTAIDPSLPTNPEDVNLDTVLFTDSEDTEDDFEISQQGARLVATKRKRGADQGSSRVDDDVRDADFVPDCPQVSAAPSSQSTPVKRGRGKRMAKRQKFKLIRRTESTSATIATATRSEAPMSTSMPQTQTVHPPIYTTAPTSQPTTIRAESSMSLPTVSLHDQISTLNSLVLRLLARMKSNQSVLTNRARRSNQQLSKTVDAHAQRIQRLEEDNKRLLEDLESRRDPTPRIEGARNDGDDGDDGDDDDDEDDVDDDDDDDSDDDDDNNDKDKDDGANAGAASSASKTAEAEARTKQKSDKSEGPSSDTQKGTEVLDVMPLKQQPSKLTYVLDMQGIIQHLVIYDKEEGEIVHCLSKEQIAELFQMNPDEVITEEASVPTTNYPSSDELEDVDEVEVEDITNQEYPKYTSVDGDDLPSFADLFTQQSDEEVNRIIDNKGDEAGPSTIDIDELNERKIGHTSTT
ncbi:hypothetical protein L1987_30466 [Smallanthus sonchifolius]|uniref:Uncharacterized protein n=1 Tax=Smallanthus sonchifolius TaxID=185202 RepID=A0ACB9I2X2_9ASTR|nr:hypothetical protein L1987_30466 [Smallanthus sonchifolius]